jgi:hypothetical protein
MFEKRVGTSGGGTHPLRTPRTRFNMKNEPRTINGTKYIQLKVLPTASFIWKRKLKILGEGSCYLPSRVSTSSLPW